MDRLKRIFEGCRGGANEGRTIYKHAFPPRNFHPKKPRSRKSSIIDNPNRRRCIVRKLRSIYGNHCVYCGIELGNKPSIDHIVPLSVGGGDSIENMTLCCIMCNRAKYNYDLSVFLKWLAHIHSDKFRCRIQIQYAKIAQNSPKIES